MILSLSVTQKTNTDDTGADEDRTITSTETSQLTGRRDVDVYSAGAMTFSLASWMSPSSLVLY